MFLIGCDFHPSWQHVCWMQEDTGETGDEKLVHVAGEVEKFYRRFPEGTIIGMESTGNCQWFVELLGRLGHGLWLLLLREVARRGHPLREWRKKSARSARNDG